MYGRWNKEIHSRIARRVREGRFYGSTNFLDEFLENN